MLKSIDGLKIIQREVRISIYNGRRNEYIANSAVVAAIYENSNPDTWKFNAWKSVGPNPLIFTSKDKDVVEADEVELIFEFVIICKGQTASKVISCGFASLSMKEFKNKQRKKHHFLDIKGGSPDQPIQADPFNFQENMGMWKKMRRGNIKSRIKIDLRYFETMSDEGKFFISMLPSTCVINK